MARIPIECKHCTNPQGIPQDLWRHFTYHEQSGGWRDIAKNYETECNRALAEVDRLRAGIEGLAARVENAGRVYGYGVAFDLRALLEPEE